MADCNSKTGCCRGSQEKEMLLLLFFWCVVECGAGQGWGESQRGTAESRNVKLFITLEGEKSG